MDEYFNIQFSDLEKQEVNSVLHQPNGLRFYLNNVTHVIAAYDCPNQVYRELYLTVCLLYQLYKHIQCCETERAVVDTLATCFYTLDEDCNVSDKVYERCMQADPDALSEMDVSRAHFKKILKGGMNQLRDHPQALNALTMFAETLFIFNAYQAPPRLSHTKAIEDALGQTDLFTEMMNEIDSELGFD